MKTTNPKERSPSHKHDDRLDALIYAYLAVQSLADKRDDSEKLYLTEVGIHGKTNHRGR